MHETSTLVLAYIDPGSGSFIFQMLMAGMLSAGFMLATWRKRISARLKTMFGQKPETSELPPKS
jgi:hypothetical protein